MTALLRRFLPSSQLSSNEPFDNLWLASTKTRAPSDVNRDASTDADKVTSSSVLQQSSSEPSKDVPEEDEQQTAQTSDVLHVSTSAKGKRKRAVIAEDGGEGGQVKSGKRRKTKSKRTAQILDDDSDPGGVAQSASMIPEEPVLTQQGDDVVAEDDNLSEPEQRMRTTGIFQEPEILAIEKTVRRFRKKHSLTQEAINELLQDRGRKRNVQRDKLLKKIYAKLPGRTHRSILNTCRRRYHNFAARAKFSVSEDEELRQAYALTPKKWTAIGQHLGRMPEDCRDRWRNYLSCGDHRRTDVWSEIEGSELVEHVRALAEAIRNQEKRHARETNSTFDDSQDWFRLVNFDTVSERLGRTRSRLQCLMHWRLFKRKEATSSRTSKAATKRKARTAPSASDHARARRGSALGRTENGDQQEQEQEQPVTDQESEQQGKEPGSVQAQAHNEVGEREHNGDAEDNEQGDEVEEEIPTEELDVEDEDSAEEQGDEEEGSAQLPDAEEEDSSEEPDDEGEDSMEEPSAQQKQREARVGKQQLQPQHVRVVASTPDSQIEGFPFSSSHSHDEVFVKPESTSPRGIGLLEYTYRSTDEPVHESSEVAESVSASDDDSDSDSDIDDGDDDDDDDADDDGDDGGDDDEGSSQYEEQEL